MRQTMKSPYPQAMGGHLKHVLDATPHLSSGLVGEGDREHGLGRESLRSDQPGDPVNQHAGFA